MIGFINYFDFFFFSFWFKIVRYIWASVDRKPPGGGLSVLKCLVHEGRLHKGSLGRKLFFTLIPRGSTVNKSLSSQVAPQSSPIPNGWMLSLGKSLEEGDNTFSWCRTVDEACGSSLKEKNHWHFSKETEQTFQGWMFCKAFFTMWSPTESPLFLPSNMYNYYILLLVTWPSYYQSFW